MFKLTNVLFFVLLSFTFSAMNKKTQCRAFGDDCDAGHLCCGDFVCRQFRCVEANDEVEEMKYTPYGKKCNAIHRCPDFYKCESHRCILQKDELSKYLTSMEQEAEELRKKIQEEQKKKAEEEEKEREQMINEILKAEAELAQQEQEQKQQQQMKQQ